MLRGFPQFLLEFYDNQMGMPSTGGGGSFDSTSLMAQRKKPLTAQAPLGQTLPMLGTAPMAGNIPPPDPNRLAGTQGQVNQAAGSYAGFQLPQFGRIGSDLYGDYTRQAGQDLSGAREAAAGQQIGQFGGIAGTDFSGAQNLLNQSAGLAGQGLGQSDLARQAGQATSVGLEALGGTPSRQQLAEQAFESLGNIENARLGKDIRSAGQRAAALGRLGSGMVDEETSDLFGGHKARLADIRRQLATDTAGQELGDRLARLQASSGILGQAQGQDLAAGQFGLGRSQALSGLAGQQAALGQAARGEQVGERGFQADLAAQRAGLAGQRAGTLAGLAGQGFGMGQGLRGEERLGNEQAFGQALGRGQFMGDQLGRLSGLEGQQFGQDQSLRQEGRGAQQQDIENRIRQYQLEQGTQQQGFENEQEVNRLLAQLAFGGGFGDQLDISQLLGQQGAGAQQGAGDLLRLLFQNQQTPAGG